MINSAPQGSTADTICNRILKKIIGEVGHVLNCEYSFILQFKTEPVVVFHTWLIVSVYVVDGIAEPPLVKIAK